MVVSGSRQNWVGQLNWDSELLEQNRKKQHLRKMSRWNSKISFLDNFTWQTISYNSCSNFHKFVGWQWLTLHYGVENFGKKFVKFTNRWLPILDLCKLSFIKKFNRNGWLLGWPKPRLSNDHEKETICAFGIYRNLQLHTSFRNNMDLILTFYSVSRHESCEIFRI